MRPHCRGRRAEEGEDVVKVMKYVSSAVMAVAGLLVCSSAASAGDVVKAKVPFAFVVNGVELPAGDYVLSRDAEQPDLVEISTAAGNRVALTLTRAGDAEGDSFEQPKLEFERIGKQVYLTEITLGPGSSRELITPAAFEEPQPKQ